MNEATNERQWYAVQLRPRFEKIVSLHLRERGYEAYLPMYRSRRRWSDRIKQIELPLFQGYIFCKFDVKQRLPILVIPGVMSVVGSGKTPLPIPDKEIESVQRIVNSGLTYGPWPSLCVGQWVRVKYGPLRGMEGVVQEFRNTCQLIISVSLLSRSVSVAIDRDSIVPMGQSHKQVAG